MFRIPKRLARMLALGMAMALMGCASSTLIHSKPPGAALYVDDAWKGYTPYLYEDRNVSFSKVKLRLELEGYEPLDVVLTRNETVEPVNVLGAMLLLFPALFVMGYDAEHTYMLKPSLDLPEEGWMEDLGPELPELNGPSPALPKPGTPAPDGGKLGDDEELLDKEFPEPGT